jgi:hypothetical protein
MFFLQFLDEQLNISCLGGRSTDRISPLTYAGISGTTVRLLSLDPNFLNFFTTFGIEFQAKKMVVEAKEKHMKQKTDWILMGLLG